MAVVGWGTSLGTLCAKAIAPGELQDSGLLAQTSAPAPASESPSPPLPTLTLGDTGPLVLKLQYLLQQQGYYPGTPQGQFDRATQQAITEFERDRKLPVDGVADAQTWQALAGVSPPASAQGAEAGQPPSQQPPAPAQTPPTPSSQDSGSQDSSPQDSTTQNPSAQNPGTQNPTTQNPSAQNPSTQNPSTQNPSTQNPDPQPLWRNPLILVLVGFMACGIVGIWGAILWANSRNSRSRDPQDQGSNPSDPANPADPFLDTPAPLEIPAPKASTLRSPRPPAPLTPSPNPNLPPRVPPTHEPSSPAPPVPQQPFPWDPAPLASPDQTPPNSVQPRTTQLPTAKINPGSHSSLDPSQGDMDPPGLIPPEMGHHPPHEPNPISQVPPSTHAGLADALGTHAAQLDTVQPDIPKLDTPKLDTPRLDTPRLDVTKFDDVAKFDLVQALIQDLQSPDGNHRRRAIWELGQQNDSRAVRPLVDLLGQSDSHQRGLILAALSEIGVGTLKPMQRALAISLQDPNPIVRKNAIRDLMRVYDVIIQTSQLLGYVMADADPEVQETAEWALEQLEKMRPKNR